MRRFWPAIYFNLFILCLLALDINAQRRSKGNSTPSSSKLNENIFEGIKLRGIGPAFMSGRIADIAIHPLNENTWYIAAGSGGVWKTDNAGITFKPIFDGQTSYSIGCVTIDPSNPSIIWVGTGENVGGRHVGFGDGIYKSEDAGQNWTSMGLPNSEHISKIVVHPKDSDVIWVASQGPLWKSGGERGLYKSTNGGKSWNKTLGDNLWVGVTDIAIDPREPDLLYAATWQRHRNVAAYMGGGRGSGIHRSLDGGETWQALTSGIPDQNLGKIGLAISPQNPDVIYAAIELEHKKGGVFKSSDRGLTWVQQSEAVAGATGPHYYQELYASPHYEGKLYLVDYHMQVSDDGGKTFYRLNREAKHSDNHAIAFKKNDKNYLLVGTDGGVYETFDLGENWRFMENLPLTQFYKVAVDDTEPFYNIFGGTQDNSTPVGPSRTDNIHGIRTADWRLVLNWDGHQPATEPGNPNIAYAERQEGQLSRIDMLTGEVIDIQPQPAEGEKTERFNWDAPILVSPHKSTRLYFASNRLWKSENRGDDWEIISPDLTKNQNRLALPIMGRTQSWNNAWDVYAMSNYNTITSIAESPKQEGLIYIGTDDGIVQVTENGGQSWKKLLVNSMPGVPSTAFVNDIKADMYEANTVYISLDNHKYGDFKPYLLKSTDRGATWQSLKGNLPNRLLVWRFVQDHKRKDLFFIATEFGIYFTIDGGSRWTKFTGGVPTISFRDLTIQRRENDLVGASFGRGFYILDDYSFLREITESTLTREATLFKARDADWYIPRPVVSFDDRQGSQGAEHFVADNPPFGALFTYYLRDSLQSKEDKRKIYEKSLGETDIPFPGWNALDMERLEKKPAILLVIKDKEGNFIRRLEAPNKAGFNRVNWDLRYARTDAITWAKKKNNEPHKLSKGGMLAVPGEYTATIFKQIDGAYTQLDEPVVFQVIPIRKSALEGAAPAEAQQFWNDSYSAQSNFSSLSITLKNELKRTERLGEALSKSQKDPTRFDTQFKDLWTRLNALDLELHGNGSKLIIGEKTVYPIKKRLMVLKLGFENSTYGPTGTHKISLEIANKQLKSMKHKLTQIQIDLDDLADAILESGGPWVEGGRLWKN